MWKGGEVEKTKRLFHEVVKKQLIESIVINEVVETDELNKKAQEVQNSKEAAEVIQEYENIIQTKKKGIICIPRVVREKCSKSLRTRRTLSH